MAATRPTSVPETVIKGPGPWYAIDFRELWQFRELFWFFVWRDLKVKYKQTALGFSWAILAPLISTFVFTIIFGRVGNMPRDGVPAGLYYLAGIIIWRYFQNSVTHASQSLVTNQALITKVYVPRLIIPAASVFYGLVDFLISFVMLVIAMAIYGASISWSLLLIPFLLLLTVVTALAVGMALGALNVKYRDIRQLVPFLLQIWMFCSIIVPFSGLPQSWGVLRYLYGLNAMGAVVEGFRWSVAFSYMPASSGPPWVLLLLGSLAAAAMTVGGVYIYRKLELEFADVV